MKKYLILLAFALVLGSNSYSQGIQFSSGTWKELLAKADKENKLIFMDAYTEWCGPCKKMAKEVFTQQNVGEFYNAKFVNVKMNMEAGEGIELASKYGVMAYPTLLFLDENGEIVHRTVGYQSSDLLIQVGEAALDPNRNAGAIKAKYDKGDRSPELLYNYAMAKYDAMDGTYSKIADEYLATQTDWSTEKNMEFVFQMANNLDAKPFNYIIQHKQAFEKKFGEQAVAAKTQQLIEEKIAKAENETDLSAVENFYAKIYPEKAAQMSMQIRMGYYAQREDWSNFAKNATAYYDKYPAQDWNELNEIAWIFYEVAYGKKELKMAAKWAEKSIKMDSNYFNNDTLAALYFKLGKKGKALKAANNAIALAKKSGDNYEETERLLEQIKTM